MSSLLRDIFLLLRPHQWVKNLLVLAPPFFGGVLFTGWGMAFIMFFAFLAFSLASSAGYIINDMVDLEADRLHPKKKLRPIASGKVGAAEALIIALAAFSGAALISYSLDTGFLLIIIAYTALSVLYSFYLQRFALVDCFVIALGFVLRLEAGGMASGTVVSNWLLLTTFVLSLLLALGKRRYELAAASADPAAHRESLSGYSLNFLDQAITIFAATAIVTYAIYALNAGSRIFLFTVGFACYGVLRYLHLVQNSISGDPTESLLRDPPLLLCVLLWLVLTAVIIYHDNLLGLFQ
ncbi:MAG TPA: decaprenyl-phosphate phosphoribosyltransferase [Thermodesulfobacteriota bacterium]|nr:decaprenyl-phosphate phosphoribosyltransferase [Thermodesulfobacteriota bacterium]